MYSIDMYLVKLLTQTLYNTKFGVESFISVPIKLEKNFLLISTIARTKFPPPKDSKIDAPSKPDKQEISKAAPPSWQHAMYLYVLIATISTPKESFKKLLFRNAF